MGRLKTEKNKIGMPEKKDILRLEMLITGTPNGHCSFTTIYKETATTVLLMER